MKVRIEDTCTGCGLCIDGCPDVFEMGDEGLAVVKVAVVPQELEASCREAAESCPVESIKMEQ